MTTLLIVIILLACVVLAFFVLVQKPKGGGLSGTFGSIGSQVMGVKQSGDIMEKGTWYTMAVIAALSIATVFTLNITRAPKANDQQKNGQQQSQGAQQGQQQSPTGGR